MRVFNIDISRKGISPVVQVTEYDAMSRFFTLVLRNGSSDYEPPENPTYSVWYKTKDSTGWYDTITLPDESTRPAVVAEGNAITIEIAEQATTSCGELALMINGDDGYQLTVSGIITRSDDIPGYDGEEVENYYNVYITRMQENAARAENAAATAIEYGATVEVDETAQQLIITHTDNTEDVQTWVTEAEAWAVGQRDGVDVPSTDATYHNNAKYYAAEYTALEGEVTELKNGLSILNIDANLLFPIYDSFERITSSQDGSWIASTNRIACRTILHTDRQIFLTADSGYNWAFNTFDSQGSYTTTSGWKSGTFAIPANTYFCVLLRKSDNSDILADESMHVYMSIPKDGIRALRQTALVYGTSGTMTEPTVTKNGTTLTVTLPTRMIILGYDFSIYIKDFSEVQTISVSHNDVLYYDFSDETIKTTSYANLSKVYTDIVILLYNNNGRPIGQFSKYFDRATETDIKLLRTVAVYADANGENAIGVSNASATSETVTAIIPVRCFVLGYTNAIYTVDKQTITRLDVPHNYVLYLDLSDNSYNVKIYSAYFNVTNDKVLLFYNNHGKAMGQWGKYQNELCSSDNFKTTIFCSRQGDIDGCPENSLIGLKRAKTFGYNRVRVSVSITSDGVPVCFHDEYLGTRSIVYDNNGNVVTNVSKKINEYTYAELQAYDFGLYKGDAYQGLEIAKLEDVVLQCRNLGCELDIEMKFGWTTTNSVDVYEMVALYGMIPHTMFIGDNSNFANLQAIIEENEYVTVAYGTTVSTERINKAATLKTGKNDVWVALLATDYSNLTDALRLLAVNQGLRFKYCSVYSTSAIPADVRKCEMIEIAYMKYPAFYFMKGI